MEGDPQRAQVPATSQAAHASTWPPSPGSSPALVCKDGRGTPSEVKDCGGDEMRGGSNLADAAVVREGGVQREISWVREVGADPMAGCTMD